MNIVQIKFLSQLLVYMLIIFVFAKYADNYWFSVKNKKQYKRVSEDLKKAHEKISLPLKFICTDIANDAKNNEADTKIPFLGMEWHGVAEPTPFVLMIPFLLGKRTDLEWVKWKIFPQLIKNFLEI